VYEISSIESPGSVSGRRIRMSQLRELTAVMTLAGQCL
jgi:hypothetical protein